MLAMEVALSPIRSQELDSIAMDASPMVINMTPTTEQDGREEVMKDHDSGEQYEKPPPLHTGADWKIVLHLPEIETWLRMTSERVRDLTYSVQQDSDSKHVDVHLVQLKVSLNSSILLSYIVLILYMALTDIIFLYTYAYSDEFFSPLETNTD